MTDLSITEKSTQKDKVGYDDFPYPNYSFNYACPEHLHTIASVFGVNAPNVETAKVLELGCGMGGNILGFAERYPKSHSIGVDFSKVQIDMGQKTVKELGLTNIELKHMSITDIDKSFGQFDYIICHGVFSWVPKEVQDKILSVMQAMLAPKGIGYVSYNTLPGWNIISSFREMLQFHSNRFANDLDKLSQARSFLQFIKDGLDGSTAPYFKFLQNEANLIANVDNSYLKHEYLDSGNSEFYFSDFMKMASEKGLAYLADTHLTTMYLGNLPAKAVEKLQTITDIVRVEQYMDFVTNRRFRNTLLVHSNNPINRNITSATIEGKWLAMKVAPSIPVSDANFANQSLSVGFAFSAGAQVTVNNNILCAAIYAFANADGRFISIDDVIQYARDKCPNFDDTHANFIKTELVALLFKFGLTIRAVKPVVASSISDRPALSKLAQIQLKNNEQLVFNQLNDSLSLNPIHRAVMVHLDGKNTVTDIVSKVTAQLDKSGQKLEINGQPVTDDAHRSKLITQLVNETLNLCLSLSFLVG